MIHRSVEIAVDQATLQGDLVLPDVSDAVVVFAHGSGSSRHSPRNRQVARALLDAGLGTLLLDLLTPAEEGVDAQTGQLRFDVDLLATRLAGAVRWLDQQDELGSLDVGYFGASTGAAAALVAAVHQPDRIAAIVSRGGRPDLAGATLPLVRAPTLLIVGGHDEVVLECNRQAQARLRCEHQLEVVPGATHLFEEPGALEQVAALAVAWFTRHLASSPTGPRGSSGSVRRPT